jgi:hypothetical protein
MFQGNLVFLVTPGQTMLCSSLGYNIRADVEMLEIIFKD